MNGANTSTDNILLLGHTGFIGSAILASIKKNMQGMEVSGLSMPGFDLTKNESVQTLLQRMTVATTLIVCSGIKKQWGDTLDTYSQNMAMAFNLCKALEERPVKRVIFYSSAEVYGEETDNAAITEETPVGPTSFYGLAKYASERLLLKVTSGRNITLCILRPPLVYGTGDTSYGYGPSGFIRAALQQVPITLWGDGAELRQFIFVSDLADLTCALVKNSYSGVLNVADGKSASFKEVLRILSGFFQIPLVINSRERTKVRVDNVYACERIKSVLPEFHFTPLEKGLKATLEAMRQTMGENQ